MKFTYYLDGKEIKPDDLAGKSGKLKIKVDYTNNTKTTVDVNGKKETMYTPFVLMTGMILPQDTFSNVKIDNGKVISDGSRNIVVGFGMPGLKESLGLNSDSLEDLVYHIHGAVVRATFSMMGSERICLQLRSERRS